MATNTPRSVKIDWKAIANGTTFIRYDIVDNRSGKILEFDFRDLLTAEQFAREQGWKIIK